MNRKLVTLTMTSLLLVGSAFSSSASDTTDAITTDIPAIEQKVRSNHSFTSEKALQMKKERALKSEQRNLATLLEEEYAGDLEALKADILVKHTEHMTIAVESGRLTQDEANTKTAELTKALITTTTVDDLDALIPNKADHSSDNIDCERHVQDLNQTIEKSEYTQHNREMQSGRDHKGTLEETDVEVSNEL